MPELVEGGRMAYVLIGAGYAGLATGVFAMAALRRNRVQRALERREFEQVGEEGVLALTVVAMLLSLATLAVIVVQL